MCINPRPVDGGGFSATQADDLFLSHHHTPGFNLGFIIKDEKSLFLPHIT
jgi:hypothetical protein